MKRLPVLVILGLFSLGGCSKKAAPVAPAVLVTAMEVQTVEAPLYLEYVGHVEPLVSVSVRPQVEGVITAKYFTEGQEVKAGDLLMTIDSRPYEAALAKAEATLALSIANLKYAEQTARRYASLVKEDYVSQLDYAQYITNVLTSEATIDQNRADIETAKINLDYCFIKAPMDAVASILTVDVGNLVQNGDSTALFTLNQIQPIYVSFYIPENDLPKIQNLSKQKLLKTQVFLKQNAAPIEGDLTLINNAVDEKTGTILLRATFTNEDKALWPGEFVDVRLILGTVKEAILLPAKAIQIGPTGPFVYVINADNTVTIRPVKKGQREGDKNLIESGLNAGEKIVLEGQLNLYPGAKVEIKEGH